MNTIVLVVVVGLVVLMALGLIGILLAMNGKSDETSLRGRGTDGGPRSKPTKNNAAPQPGPQAPRDDGSLFTGVMLGSMMSNGHTHASPNDSPAGHHNHPDATPADLQGQDSGGSDGGTSDGGGSDGGGGGSDGGGGGGDGGGGGGGD